MSLESQARGLAAIGTFCGLCVPASFDLNSHVLWHVLTHTPEPKRHHFGSRFQCYWGGTVMLPAVTRVLGLQIDLQLPDHPVLRDRTRPLMFVSNHQATLDSLVLLNILWQLGRTNARGPVKTQLKWAPLAGRSSVEAGCIFVGRRRDPQDLVRLRAGAALAYQERASMYIFPEGHRFREPRAGSGYKHVLPPKKDGLIIMREELHDYPILSLTINWVGMRGGKTMLQAEGNVGKRAIIRGEVLEHLPTERTGQWLDDEWQRKERLFAEQRDPLTRDC